MEGEFDIATGEIRFDDLGLRFGPELTHSGFAAHADASRFQPHAMNPPYGNYRAPAHLGGVPFTVVVHFDGELVTHLWLSGSDPAVAGTSWGDYDPALLRRFHDEWLEHRLGRGKPWNRSSYPYGGVEYGYRWGTIGSYLHPQDAIATIIVRYR